MILRGYHVMMDDEYQLASFGEIYDDAVNDFFMFDNMVDEWNEEYPQNRIWRRMLPNFKYMRHTLRGGIPETGDDWWPLGWIPSDYDWKASVSGDGK